MTDTKLQTTESKVLNWMLWSIPVVFLLGGMTHFLYEWTGENVITGIFAPVNESPWEHLKMSFWVNLIFWLAGYAVLRKNKGFSPVNWFAACASALYVCALFILSFFYAYTGALGVESLAVDILSFLLGIAVSQLLAWHIYRFGQYRRSCLILSVLAIAILAAAFILFTFSPPQLPMFLDPNTGTYGM